jgi:nickel-dependent lactate racemase
MLYYAKGGPNEVLTDSDLKTGLTEALDALGTRGKVLALPPDMTRYHSRAGILTDDVAEYYGGSLTDVMPAIGTHFPMTDEEIEAMFPGTPKHLFRVHDWRNSLETLGTIPGEMIEELSEGKLDYEWPCELDQLVASGGHDLILSIGQVVPHEVIGMANFTKNVFIGTGGKESINKSHYLGAVYGMERIMGRADSPVRAVLNHASEQFASHLPIVYVLTVVGAGDDGLVTRGLFIGDDSEAYYKAAELALSVNFTMVPKPLQKVVVYLDKSEFKSTWLGNKSIYRTRMAIADGGELIVLAPGVRQFGEDPGNDELIRKYGYAGTEKVLKLVDQHEDLQQALGAAAHLIHGSSEGRFSITYCPGGLSQGEIEGVNFAYADLEEMQKRYDPAKMKDGFNTMSDGEEVFYISNPAVGLWAHEDRFKD